VLGLVFVVGKLLDDSIIVVEVIRREIERGVHPRGDVVPAAESVQNAIFAATFTFVVMLFPMTQMTGDMGSGLRSMPLPTTTSVVASLFRSLILTPLMCSYLFEPKETANRESLREEEALLPSTEPPPGRLGWVAHILFLRDFHSCERLFSRVIGPALEYRWIVMAFMAGSLYITFTLFDRLEQEQMPLTDTSLALGYIRAEPGTSFARMSEVVRAVERAAPTSKISRSRRRGTGECR